MLHPLHDETMFAKLVIGSENAEKRTDVVVLHVAKYRNLPHGLSNDESSTKTRTAIYAFKPF